MKYGGTFLYRVFVADGDNFWEAYLLRGYSAWGINDQIIMLRAGEFSLGEAGEDCLEVCFVGLVVRRNYEWCLVIFVIFVMRFGGAEVWDALKPSLGGGNANYKSEEAILMGKEVGVLTIYDTAVFKLCYWVL